MGMAATGGTAQLGRNAVHNPVGERAGFSGALHTDPSVPTRSK